VLELSTTFAGCKLVNKVVEKIPVAMLKDTFVRRCLDLFTEMARSEFGN